MTTHKTFKRRVRARSAKTGESYTAARARLLAKVDAPVAPSEPDTQELTGMSDEAFRAGSGRPIGEWLGILDAWGATDRTHTEIARWLVAEHEIGGWWAQSVTVAYERARGMRAKHERATGFYGTVTRTVGASPERITDAFTDAGTRAAWLPDAPMRQRTATRGRGARFDWDDPPSRVVVALVEKGPSKTQVAVTHERLPDADAVARVKELWRERLSALKELLESG
jgi:uncharacterized protein YndB with AHSA1/START domain